MQSEDLLQSRELTPTDIEHILAALMSKDSKQVQECFRAIFDQDNPFYNGKGFPVPLEGLEWDNVDKRQEWFSAWKVKDHGQRLIDFVGLTTSGGDLKFFNDDALETDKRIAELRGKFKTESEMQDALRRLMLRNKLHDWLLAQVALCKDNFAHAYYMQELTKKWCSKFGTQGSEAAEQLKKYNKTFSKIVAMTEDFARPVRESGKLLDPSVQYANILMQISNLAADEQDRQKDKNVFDMKLKYLLEMLDKLELWVTDQSHASSTMNAAEVLRLRALAFMPQKDRNSLLQNEKAILEILSGPELKFKMDARRIFGICSEISADVNKRMQQEKQTFDVMDEDEARETKSQLIPFVHPQFSMAQDSENSNQFFNRILDYAWLREQVLYLQERIEQLKSQSLRRQESSTSALTRVSGTDGESTASPPKTKSSRGSRDMSPFSP